MIRPIYYPIIAMLALVLTACADNPAEGIALFNDEGEMPFAFKPVEPDRSRAVTVSTINSYDFFTCGIMYNTKRRLGYYTKTSSGVFMPMSYLVDDNGNKLLYIYKMFYPSIGTMDIFTYAVEKNKTSVKAYCLPKTDLNGNTADYMVLDLTQGYDGSYDIIAASRMTVNCALNLEVNDLPFAKYRHVMAHITVKVKWADGVASDSWILSRLKVSSVKIMNTSSQGLFYVAQNVDDGHWEDQGDPAIIALTTPRAVNYSSGINLGYKYVIPQALRQPLALTYSITNGSGTKTVTKTMTYVVQEDPNLNLSWEAGHKYTYIIEIGDNGSISLDDVIVEEFAEGKVGTTEII